MYFLMNYNSLELFINEPSIVNYPTSSKPSQFMMPLFFKSMFVEVKVIWYQLPNC